MSRSRMLNTAPPKKNCGDLLNMLTKYNFKLEIFFLGVPQVDHFMIKVLILTV